MRDWDASVRVKICGMTNQDDALWAAAHGADALGFIFYSKSPRFIKVDAAREIVSVLPPFVTPVGVFVNEPRDRVEATAREVGLRAVQLHGDESPEACAGFLLPVIKALRVGETFDPSTLEAYPVDTFLLDTDKKGLYGGTGETFDWSIAREAKQYGRIVLSGGLSPENVAEAVRQVQPYAVDCGSGVEADPGKKDCEKVRAFIEAVVSGQ